MLTLNKFLLLFIYGISPCLSLNSSNASSTGIPSSPTTTDRSITTTITTTTTTTQAATTTPVPKPSPPKNHTKTYQRSLEIKFNCEYTKSTIRVDLLKDGQKIFSVNVTRGGKVILSDRNLTYSGGTSSLKIFLSDATFSDTGVYVCYKYNGENSYVRGTSYNITVNGAPILQLKPPNLNYQLFTGQSLKIRCTGIANPVADYMWVDHTLPVRNFSDLYILSFEDVRNYTYTCVGNNSIDKSEENVFVQVYDSKPDQPIFIASKIEQTSIEISWKPGLKSGNSKLMYYLLRYKDVVLNFTKTSHMFQKLQPYTKYSFGLRACNAKHNCSVEVTKNVSTLEQERPSKPTDLRIQNIHSNNVTVSFKHGEHRSRQNVISCVSVFESTRTSSCDDLEEGIGCDRIASNETSHTIMNLTAFQSYVVLVVTCVDTKSQKCEGRCKPTCSVCAQETFKTLSGMSSPATSLKVENSDSVDIEVKVSWERPVRLNSQRVQYKIKYRKLNNTVVTVNTKFSSTHTKPTRMKRDNGPQIYTQTLKNLSGSTLYYVMVVTVNEKGERDTPWINIQTDEAVPSAVSNLKLVKARADSLSLSWVAPTSVPAVQFYRLNYTLKDGVFPKSDIISQQSKIIPNLKEKSEYKISVEAMVERKRDQIRLFGKAQHRIFATVEASDDNALVLAIVTTVMIIIIIIVIIGAILYCRSNGLCGLTYKSTFYTDEKEHAAFAFSLRQSLKTLESKHVAMTLEEFEKHVKELHANSDYLFSEEYESLGPNRPDRTCHSAHAEENVTKNRYVDIAPYDQTRVRLMTIDGVPGSNYINANFVDGYHKAMAYIATQAPLNHTLADFWRMVWENNSYCIVMLTNLEERGRKKCEQYWPTEGSVSFQCFNVSLVSTRRYANYIIRELTVTKTTKPSGKTRRIWQYHYTEWPDFGVPRDAVSVLSFILHTREHEKELNAPPILHCSAGVGRTGTFLVLDAQMRRYEHRQDVEIYNFLKKIRQQRNYLVQQEVQYRFIHDALLEYIRVGNTRIPVVDLEDKMNQEYWIGDDEKESRLTKEWKLHESNVVISQNACGMRLCNRPKNRDQRFVPVENHRVRLSMIVGVEGTDYINASYVDSFHMKKSYILTQAPMQNTVEDLWRMMWENHIPIIVDLLTHEEMKDEDVIPYLPTNVDVPEAYGKFEVKISTVEEFDNFAKRVIRLKNTENTEHSLEVVHYNYFNWSPDVFPRSAFLFDFMFEVLQCKDRIEEEHVVTHSYDRTPTMAIHSRYGKGRSGVLSSLFNLKEQLEDVSGQVDVYSTVRTLLSQRPGVLETKEEYDFLYKAAVGLKQYVSRKGSSVERKER